MEIRYIVIIMIIAVGFLCTFVQSRKKNTAGTIIAIMGTLLLGITTNLISDIINPILLNKNEPVSTLSASNGDTNQEDEVVDIKNKETESEAKQESPAQPAGNPSEQQPSPSTASAPSLPDVSIENITGRDAFDGAVSEKNKENSYKYTASVAGTYRFYAELSAGGQVKIRISGENGNSIKYGTDAVSLDLEAGKTYILSVEYSNGPCDYTIKIGVPIEIATITDTAAIVGSITYQDQINKYIYTAPYSGTYRFDSNLSAGGQVKIRISGENGNSIKYGIDGLSLDLEAGKTYVLSVEYSNELCEYEVIIQTPQ